MQPKNLNVEPELIRFNDVAKILGRSRDWIYKRLRSDETFPRPLQITPHSVVFRRSDVMAWINSLPVSRADGLNAVERRQAA